MAVNTLQTTLSLRELIGRPPMRGEDLWLLADQALAAQAEQEELSFLVNVSAMTVTIITYPQQEPQEAAEPDWEDLQQMEEYDAEYLQHPS